MELHSGMFLNSLYYNTFICTAVEFVAQLHKISDQVKDAKLFGLRRLAPGPGTWISPSDLEYLHEFGIDPGFRLLEPTAKASQFRLLHDLGKMVTEAALQNILDAQVEHLTRPRGDWRKQSYAGLLCDNARVLRSIGIRYDNILREINANGTGMHVQKIV